MDSEMSADKYTAHQIAAEARRMAGSTWQPIGCEECGGSPDIVHEDAAARYLRCRDCGDLTIRGREMRAESSATTGSAATSAVVRVQEGGR